MVWIMSGKFPDGLEKVDEEENDGKEEDDEEKEEEKVGPRSEN